MYLKRPDTPLIDCSFKPIRSSKMKQTYLWRSLKRLFYLILWRHLNCYGLSSRYSVSCHTRARTSGKQIQSQLNCSLQMFSFKCFEGWPLSYHTLKSNKINNVRLTWRLSWSNFYFSKWGSEVGRSTRRLSHAHQTQLLWILNI